MFRYLLDTNIVIYVIKRRPIEVLDTFNANAGLMCINSITYAELMHGVEKSTKPVENRRLVQDFVSRLSVLDYGMKAAEHYGDIRAHLEKQGKTIGINDLHIAASARSEGLIVVTNNECEFSRVDGLRVENWVK
ncbi:type II toxin-antitoxin system tRNA(fMet)-specific endonuclease VapC [Parashewanella tropica]|uniref:type II toxin-antitoxin system tRNA(fMet)-specific endonuclease VapC n=1 Tax=Parashewanella tropica TaxID=2547970 RepID=UPI001059CA22|nr:tRNA(fMet)-specific endonuclease VapC [Parashewanella tropica]